MIHTRPPRGHRGVLREIDAKLVLPLSVSYRGADSLSAIADASQRYVKDARTASPWLRAAAPTRLFREMGSGRPVPARSSHTWLGFPRICRLDYLHTQSPASKLGNPNQTALLLCRNIEYEHNSRRNGQ